MNLSLNHRGNATCARSSSQPFTGAVNNARLVRTFGFAPRRLLLLIWAALVVGAPAPTAHAQGSIPALRGVYQGTFNQDLNCSGSPPLGGQFQLSLTITSQVNQSFSGQGSIPDGAGDFTISLSGTVDSTGRLQGTYDYQVTGAPTTTTGSGTFTGNSMAMWCRRRSTSPSPEPLPSATPKPGRSHAPTQSLFM